MRLIGWLVGDEVSGLLPVGSELFCFSFCQVPFLIRSGTSTMAAMDLYPQNFKTDENGTLVKQVAAHLAEPGVSKPTDLGFLSRVSGGVSAGMVRLGCPQWWTAEHFDILRRAIEAQASNRHGVEPLLYWSLLLLPEGGSIRKDRLPQQCDLTIHCPVCLRPEGETFPRERPPQRLDLAIHRLGRLMIVPTTWVADPAAEGGSIRKDRLPQQCDLTIHCPHRAFAARWPK